MDGDAKKLFPRLVGGDEARFFREHWRKRTLFSQGAVPEFRDLYDYSHFLDDYRRLDFHDGTLLAGVDDQRRRMMFRPGNMSVVDEGLARGFSVVLQALLLPETELELPPPWRMFLTLYDTLCDYLLPGLPPRVQPGGAVAALDIFCTASETSIGGHYDTGDVFYFVLEGEKEWTVELTPDPAEGHRLAAEGTNYLLDRAALNEHLAIGVRPGDCLYVPPYTYHRVRSTGKSLAISFGLPTFTEITLLQVALNRVQRERMLYEPLPSFPRSENQLFCDAEQEVRRRSRGVLELLGAP